MSGGQLLIQEVSASVMAHHLSIVLLGNSGVGKSASGNTILGQKVFESRKSFKSVTTKISEETKAVFGRQISVIDTPGILGYEQDIEKYCQDLLKKTTSCLFLLVVKIDRFTEEQQRAAETAIRAVGPQGLNRIYLLFTSGDTLNVTLEEFINEQDEGPLRELVVRLEGRYLKFNNKDGGQEQVRELLQKSGSLPGPSSPQEERRILLFGLSGAGKSSSGNTILGSASFKSAAGFESVTTECVSQSANVNGRLVTVTDTPGFTHHGISSDQQASNLLKALQRSKAGFHALVIVVKIDRVDKTDLFLLQQFPNLFGRAASKYTMVLFTRGDELRGKSMDNVIAESRPMLELMDKCSGRYCVFDNTQRGNQLQVREFLGKVEEIVAANDGRYCSLDNMDQPGTFQKIKEWIMWLINMIKDLIMNAETKVVEELKPFMQPTLSY